MSGTVRAGLIFGFAAVLAVVVSAFLPIPCLGPILVTVLGVGAGYTAAKTTGATRDQRIGRGATTGAIGGLIALVGSVIALFLVYNIPAYQQVIQQQVDQMLRQSPELAEFDRGTLVAAAIGIASFCSGIINFLLMLVGGIIGSLFWKGTPPATAAATDYEPSSGDSPYPPPSRSSEGGGRVYDTDEADRT